MITRIKRYTLYFVLNIGVLLCLCAFINNIEFDSYHISNQTTNNESFVTLSSTSSDEEMSYTDYLSKYSSNGANIAHQEFIAANVITSSNPIVSLEDSFGYGNKTVKLENKQTAEFELVVETAGLYEIYIDYYFYDSSINDVEANFKINGEHPYYESRQVLFKADWVPVTKEFELDRYGNEIIPSSSKDFKWYKYANNQDRHSQSFLHWSMAYLI